MAYVRPVKKHELVEWLLGNGYAEEESGYGHVSAEELAEALIDEFDLVKAFRTP